MAVSYTVSDWITNAVVTDATNLDIPWASLPEAAQNCSDVREIVKSLLEDMITNFEGMTTPDIPTKLTMTSTDSFDNSSSEIERTYVIKLKLDTANDFRVGDSVALPTDAGA